MVVGAPWLVTSTAPVEAQIQLLGILHTARVAVAKPTSKQPVATDIFTASRQTNSTSAESRVLATPSYFPGHLWCRLSGATGTGNLE